MNFQNGVEKIKASVMLGFLISCTACMPHTESAYKWTEFVYTKAHTNAIPKSWISTPSGRFAHNLLIPQPVPADPGYKSGMKPVEYYQLLCDKEAGEFTYKKVQGEKSLYFARLPTAPTDDDLKDRWKLEYPWLEKTYQLESDRDRRSRRFLGAPSHKFTFIEEPNDDTRFPQPYWRMSDYQDRLFEKDGVRTFISVPGSVLIPKVPMKETQVNQISSEFGITWRGIYRPYDRENGISGGEVIIYDLKTDEILYVFRNFAFSGQTRGTPDGVWWLTSGGCKKTYRNGDHLDARLGKRAEEILNPSQ